MSKKYCFEFCGTRNVFLNQLTKFPNNNKEFYYFDDYIVELSESKIRFGIARGGHSGGYWFIPEITEVDDKTIFCGSIQYISPYTTEKGIKKLINKLEEILLLILFMPVIIIVKIYLGISWVMQKILKRVKPKEASLEDKLFNLMENHLNCKRN